MTEFLTEALTFAKRGVHVFPCAENDKMPAIGKSSGGHGCNDATTNADKIRAWWRENAKYNIGIATGERSRVWVLDIDTKDDGALSLRQLEAVYGALPETRMAITPTGGMHYYWRWNPDKPVKNSTSKIGKGIDTRGKGGYVVAPPSVRPQGEYVWLTDCPSVEAPEWLLTVLNREEPRRLHTPRDFTPPTNEEAMRLLERLAPWRCDNYDAWANVGMALAELGGEGLRLWDWWSRKSNKYKPGLCDEKWPSFEPEGIKFGSLVYWASQDSPAPIRPPQNANQRNGRGLKMTSEDYGRIIASGR